MKIEQKIQTEVQPEQAKEEILVSEMELEEVVGGLES